MGLTNKTAEPPATAGASGTEKKDKEPKAPKAPKVKAKTGIKFLREIDPKIDRLNNQQKVLVDAMLKLVGKDGVVSREALLHEVTSETLKSRQPAERVLGFYLNGWKKEQKRGKEGAETVIPPLFSLVQIAA